MYIQSAMIERLVSHDSTERPSADEVLLSELFVSKDEVGENVEEGKIIICLYFVSRQERP